MNNYSNNMTYSIKIGFKIFIFTLKNSKTFVYEKIKKIYDKICDKICDFYLYVYSFSGNNKKSEDEKIQIILSEFILKNSDLKSSEHKEIETELETKEEEKTKEAKETVEVKQIHIQFYKLIQQILYKENRDYNKNTKTNDTNDTNTESEEEQGQGQKHEISRPEEEIITSSDGEYEIL